mgnify:CR=1
MKIKRQKGATWLSPGLEESLYEIVLILLEHYLPNSFGDKVNINIIVI